MKTIREFDYDLFKIEDDHYIRVKRTGEVVKVSIEVFRLLRNENMKQYRENKGRPVYKLEESRYHLLDRKVNISLESLPDNSNEIIKAIDDVEGQVICNIILSEFYNTLTNNQKDVLNNCMLSGISIREFARIKCINQSSVNETVQTIRIKMKKYLD